MCLSLNFSEFRARIENKEDLKEKFKKERKDLISKYKHGSEFHRSLESAYDEDVEVYIAI